MTPVTLDSVGTTAQQAATGPDTLTSYQIKNGNGYTIYVKLYDAEADDVDPASSVPDEVITVAANSTATSDSFSFSYTTALSLRCTKESADNDTTAVSVSPLVDLQFTPFIIHSASVTLTNAQIKALPTTGVEIVPAQAGKAIIVVNVLAHHDWVADYTNIANTCTMQLTYGNGVFACGPLSEADGENITALLAPGANDQVAIFPQLSFSSTGYAQASAGIADSDLVGRHATVKMTNGASGNLTGGDANSTLKVTVYYAAVSI